METTIAGVSTSTVTIGLDVGDRFSTVRVLGRDGEVLEESTVRTTRTGLMERFKGIDPCRVIIEVGSHSPWISRALASFGHEVVVANPHRERLIAESRQKDDRTDAETLARLGRIDPKLLSPVQHRSQRAQNDLALLRSRDALVACRSLLINHARGVVKASGERLPASGTATFPRKVAESVPAALLPALAPVLTPIESLTVSIGELDRQIGATIARHYPEALRLQQVPGVGPLTSLAFVLTVGDPSRFETSRAVGAFCGLIPGRRESGERRPQLGITKAGDGLLRRLLVQAAHYILGPFGPDSDLRRWGLGHAGTASSGKKRAIIGVARKLAVLLHRLWVSGEPYRPLRESAAV